MVGSLTRSVSLAWAGSAFTASYRQSSTNEGGYSGSRGYNAVKSFCSLGLHVPTGEAGNRSQPGTAGTGRKAGSLMTSFLDNWENSRCWDVQAPESEADGETITSEVPAIPRPVASDERATPRPEPLGLGAGALLPCLGICVRYINSPEGAE